MSAAERTTAIDWALSTQVADRAVEAASNKTLIERLGAVFLVATVLLIAVYSWVRPDYNWDMLAYIGSALENRYEDPVDLHRETWAEISKGAREGQLYNLQYGNPYNVHQWENPADFESQLSMFRVKIAYVQALRLLEPIFGLTHASILLNVLPLLGIGLLALFWLREEKALQASFLLIPALMLADLTHMTTAVTPDMLLAVLSLVAVYWLMKGKDIAACVLLFASVLVRPDNIIFVFALLLTALVFGWRKLPIAVTFAVSFISCVAIEKLSGHPGWWPHFYFSCVQIQHSMINFSPDFSLFAMAHGYVRGLMVAFIDNDWPGLYVILIAAWALLQRAGKMGDGRANALMFAFAIGTLGKFASFPLPDDRFYFVFIAGMLFIVLTRWKPRFDTATGRLSA